ncbi:MAG: hydrogenase formation protein HypD [Planctomycetota bacterium]|jgi:hydrogenase expression/formation protein HypD
MDLKYLDEFRDPSFVKPLLKKIEEVSRVDPIRIMEVCGTHTMAISRGGIRSLLSGMVTLISGPGCPVCVTPDGFIDAAIKLGMNEKVMIATFGDMIKVPGKKSSLEKEKADGLDLRIVYSPIDALKIAEQYPGKEVVFLGVGFETTAPSVGGAIIMAEEMGISNFSILSSMRTVPEAMEALVLDPEVMIEGFLCPAHVSTIIGADAYLPIVERHGIPCVVAGFEYLDIFLGINMLMSQIKEGKAKVENEYKRVARSGGNLKAQEVIEKVFERVDALWRGIGVIPSSGLTIKKEYEQFDAEKRFGVRLSWELEETACRCGDVLKGKIIPPECPLFGESCTPSVPFGPCMVSSEGACAAYYKYGGI